MKLASPNYRNICLKKRRTGNHLHYLPKRLLSSQLLLEQKVSKVCPTQSLSKNNAECGLHSVVASGAIWTPMDVLKQRLQTGRESTKSAPVLIKRIWKEEGYRGVWRGYFFSLAQFGPYGKSSGNILD